MELGCETNLLGEHIQGHLRMQWLAVWSVFDLCMAFRSCLNIAVAYTSRHELVQAIKEVVGAVEEGILLPRYSWLYRCHLVCLSYWVCTSVLML